VTPPPAGTIGFLMPWGSGGRSRSGGRTAPGHQGPDFRRCLHA
jgi:hypothetical protein